MSRKKVNRRLPSSRLAALEAELARLRERVEALERPRQPLGFFCVAGSRIQQDPPQPADAPRPRAG